MVFLRLLTIGFGRLRVCMVLLPRLGAYRLRYLLCCLHSAIGGLWEAVEGLLLRENRRRGGCREM